MKAASIVFHFAPRLAMRPAAFPSFTMKETRGFIGLQYNPPIKISNPYYDAVIDLARKDVEKLHQTIDFSRLSVNERFETARIAAAQDGWRTSEYIKNYGLTKLLPPEGGRF